MYLFPASYPVTENEFGHIGLTRPYPCGSERHLPADHVFLQGRGEEPPGHRRRRLRDPVRGLVVRGRVRAAAPGRPALRHRLPGEEEQEGVKGGMGRGRLRGKSGRHGTRERQ